MCRMCEGFSLDDVLALDTASIAEYGFTLIGVGPPDGGDPESPTWVYTVGLLDTAGHPEMIMAGAKVETNASVLGRLATAVLAGERFEVGDAFDIRQGDGRVGAVHPIQYELNTFNMWHNPGTRGYCTLPSSRRCRSFCLPPSSARVTPTCSPCSTIRRFASTRPGRVRVRIEPSAGVADPAVTPS